MASSHRLSCCTRQQWRCPRQLSPKAAMNGRRAMKIPRRQFLHLAAGAAALPAVTQIARAQTALAGPKTGTRVITLGTLAGPLPRAHRAQASNLLIVNGAVYVVDVGDGAARRI